MHTATSITVDLSYLHTVTGGDAAFEKMLLENAINDIQLNVNKLHEAWHQKDAVAIRSAAHTLKPVVAIAGLVNLETLCKKTDNIFADGNFHPEAETGIQSIIQNWQYAKPALEKIIAQG